MANGQLRSAFGQDVPFFVDVRKINFEGIFVKKRLAVQGSAGQHIVVHDAFYHIRIAGVRSRLLHGKRKQLQSQSRTALRIRFEIGQVVRHRKRLAVFGGTYAAGYVHFSKSDVFNQPVARRQQLFVARVNVRLAHCGIKIYCAHRMTFRPLQTAHRYGALIVISIPFVAPRLVAGAAFVDKEHRHIEVFLHPRIVVQLYERQLYLFVTAGVERRRFLGDKRPFYAIDVFFHHVEKFVFARRLVICHRRLDKVPGAVQFVIAAVFENVLRLYLNEMRI